MKTLTTVLALLFFALPSVSFAAALTQQQSTSLIAVVQSSPGTPASAFVSLITAFSNITVTQATSLITVVQAAPSVPANAFVDLLTSFTVDTPVVQSTTTTTTPTDVCTNIEGIQTTVPGGMSATGNVCIAAQANTPTTATAVQSPVIKELKINRQPYRQNQNGVYYSIEVYYTEDGKGIEGVPVTISAPDGDFNSDGKRYNLTATQNTHRGVGTGTIASGIGVWFQYMPMTKEDRTITVTANGITESIVGAGNELAYYIIEDGVVKKVVITGDQ
jgi:hypothetical protein